MNRGNNRATVFNSPADYLAFVGLMVEAQARQALDLLAVCLMPNHFHLVARPLGDLDLSDWMHWLLTTHVRRHHGRQQSTGRVWQGRFKAFPGEQPFGAKEWVADAEQVLALPTLRQRRGRPAGTAD